MPADYREQLGSGSRLGSGGPGLRGIGARTSLRIPATRSRKSLGHEFSGASGPPLQRMHQVERWSAIRVALCSLLMLFCAVAAFAADPSCSSRRAGRKACRRGHLIGGSRLAGRPFSPQVISDRTQFSLVLIMPVGAEVSFPNRDRGTPPRLFLFAGQALRAEALRPQDAKPLRFSSAPAPSPLGCNIHDSMVAFIKVVDTPFAAKSGASGSARLCVACPPAPAGGAASPASLSEGARQRGGAPP